MLRRAHQRLLSLYGRLPRRMRRFAVRRVAPSFRVGAMCFVERDDGALLLVRHAYRSNWGVPGDFTRSYYPLAASNDSRGTTYYGRVDITNANLSPPAAYSDNMRSVLVTINWTNGGVAHTRSMGTYVARNGMQSYVFYSTNN